MKKKKGWCFEKVVVFALAVVLLVSFVAIAAYTAGEHRAEVTTHIRGVGIHGGAAPISKAVVWDNGMQYGGLLSAQIDPVEGFDSEPADDFMFATDQLVNDVHWIGGYWNPVLDGNFDWKVTFYNDFGDGTKPGAAITSYSFANAQVNETLIEATYAYICSYSVDLPATLTFLAGTKYWISIQGVGAYAPQSGWGFHDDQILLHEAVFRSVYYSVPNWTNTTDVLGYPIDMCFQLTYEGEEWPNHKMHFPQLPDLIGWDVNATFPKTLADDWQCSRTGPVEDIHFWGSWRDLDGIPETDDFFTPMPWFQLSIHENIPADPDTPWSRPGRQVWIWEGEIGGTPSDPPTLEGWLDPNTGEVLCNDHVPYWRYDFFVEQADPPIEPFIQYQDTIYWLNISALGIQPPYQWGWKNTTDHFMDDACYTDNAPMGPWYPIIEPPRCNWFDVYFGPIGMPPEDLGSTNYYGQGWYFYEQYDWWNMWFYNNPFVYNPKHIWLEFYVDFPYPHSWAEFAINWSTDIWSLEGEPGRPPLPQDGNEDLYIGRQEVNVVPGWNTVDYWIDAYNPEWVSIDFRAEDVMINGWIWHECVPTSLDLAFVITGPECEPSVEAFKYVWDEEQQLWIELVDLDVGETAEFLVQIHNDGTCCDLTNIDVYDFMDESLEFLSADPPPDLVQPVPGGTELTWLFPGPLSPCNWIYIEVLAEVLGPVCHTDSNYVFVEAYCETADEFVTDEDAAYVHATEPPWPNHKMHYPQLPDPNGWDVVATQGYDMHPGIVAADDFMCMESGPITGIHFWGSWLYDMELPILGFWLSIHDNIPAPPYSMPGHELWSAYVTDYEMVPEGDSPQGWYDPFAQWWEHPNHMNYYRYDITDIPVPFVQDSGTIYWLNVMADIGPVGYQGFPEPPLWGWKTSGSPHFEDDAVWAVWTPPVYEWIPLVDPITGLTLDLAFVITTSEIPVICGDVNNDGIVNVGDIVYLVSYLYKGGPAPIPMPCVGDVNNDDIVNVGDIVYLVSYLYKGGPVPDPNCCNPPWKE